MIFANVITIAQGEHSRQDIGRIKSSEKLRRALIFPMPLTPERNVADFQKGREKRLFE